MIVTYTRGTTVYVTTSAFEHQFLNWMQRNDLDPKHYTREFSDKVAVLLAPHVAQKSATVLKLVKDDDK